MFYARYFIVTVLVCIVFVSDLDAKRMPLEEDLTALIDYEQYQARVNHQRVRREVATSTNHTQPFYPKLPFPTHYSNECDDDDDECETKVCADPVNEVYQKCGSKCVLGCRYAATSSGTSLTISKLDCEKNDCVEGCFCKTGLVRHQTKCIPATECPVRRCNHRYEVYMCGPAAPITCDNALREDEIVDLTKHVECVWGCYCARGYLRDNINGKCVPEQECQNTKAVDISPQIPGLFKHLTGCGPKGCGSNNHETGCGSNGCNNEGGHHHYTGSENSDSDSDSDSSEVGNGNNSNGNGSNLGPSHDMPEASWAVIPGPPIHHWNDTGKLQLAGANINDTPLTTVTIANGTKITTPVDMGSKIDVESEIMNTESTLGDEATQYDGMESEEVNDEIPTAHQVPMISTTNKPEITSDEIKESNTTPPPPMQNENTTPQTTAQTQAPVEIPVNVANDQSGSKPQIPLQIPVAVASPVKPTNGNVGNKKPNSNKVNDSAYTSPGNSNNHGQRPPFLLPQYIPNNYFGNQQIPNNGMQTPFINPFIPFNNYPANPNFGYNQNTALNGAQNIGPNKAQNIQPYAASYYGSAQPQFVPQNVYNRPIVPNRIQNENAPNKNKVQTQVMLSREDEDESKSEEYESNSSEDSQQQNTQNVPPKKTAKVPTNSDTSGNKVPPNYQAYFNFLNQFNPNQGNTNQGNPNQSNQQKFNPNQANQHQFNPNQLYQNQYNPNYFNLQYNPNQYYPNNFNIPYTNGFPPQFTAQNTQLNQYNPYHNPFNAQNVNAFLNQANPNFGNFPKPGNSNPTTNQQIMRKPNRK